MKRNLSSNGNSNVMADTYAVVKKTDTQAKTLKKDSVRLISFFTNLVQHIGTSVAEDVAPNSNVTIASSTPNITMQNNISSATAVEVTGELNLLAISAALVAVGGLGLAWYHRENIKNSMTNLYCHFFENSDKKIKDMKRLAEAMENYAESCRKMRSDREFMQRYLSDSANNLRGKSAQLENKLARFQREASISSNVTTKAPPLRASSVEREVLLKTFQELCFSYPTIENNENDVATIHRIINERNEHHQKVVNAFLNYIGAAEETINTILHRQDNKATYVKCR